jgi:hypothetical protein
MKKLILLVFICFLFSKADATIHTVNNMPNGPGQFATIDAAITVSSGGDTIYVNASTLPYPAFTITKSLTIIGPGAFNQTQWNTDAVVGTITINSNINGIKIKGINTSNISLNAKNNVNNVEIANNYITSVISISSLTNCSNIIIRNNIIKSSNTTAIDFLGTTIANGNSNFLIENNIIENASNAAIRALSVFNSIIQNNIFLGGSSNTNTFVGTNSNLIIQNNIFYNKNASTNVSSSSYYNNLTYSNSAALPALGGNNLDNQDPIFVNVPSALWNVSYNYHFQPSSPCINAGNDSTDIGYFGGANTNVTTTGEVYNMPVIRSMSIQNTSVPQNGNVNVKVRSTKSRTN